jgi:MYXO-CTERM domain-containing protein
MLLGTLVWSTLALASSYPSLGFRMRHSQQSPFRYYVDSRQTPPGISISQAQTAVNGAYQAWAGVACAHPAFSSSGLTSSVSISNINDVRDRYNVTPVFVTSRSDPAYSAHLGSGNSAMSAVPLHYAGYLYQCDIFVNATGDFPWSTATPTQPGYLDLQTFLTKQIGHCMGLAHVVDPSDAVMYYDVGYGQMRRTLTQHDVDHLCALYPQTGKQSGPCTAGGTCDTGLTCVSAPEANGLPGYRICTTGCTGPSPGACPDSLACKLRPGGSTYACLPNMEEYITQVGNACGSNSQCNSPWGLCLAPMSLPTTTAWPGGYCTQGCGADSVTCPSGSTCVALGNGPSCLKDCQPGASGTCRPGYICPARGSGPKVCVSACNSDSDCGTGYACSICDNTCVPQQKPGVTLGTPCNSDAECGTYQECLKPNGHPQGICSQPCGYNTCSCPDGASCQPVGPNGKSMCVQGCSGTSCGSGLQCAPFAGGATGCMPTCRANGDCQSGFICASGQCQASGSWDGGSCPLCPGPGTPDAGTPPVTPPASDAGTGSGGTAGPGCGCQGSAVNAPGFLGALALFLVAARRRRCQRP